MQTVDEKPETIHLYVVREEAPKPSFAPIILSALALLLVVVVSVVSPYQQPVTRAVIRVPAVLLPIRTFNATVAIIPTGVRVYPATTAHGVLTITIGSVVSQTLPAELTFVSNTGVPVITDEAVFIPAGDVNGYGWAQVRAHAEISGHRGNLPPYSINSVIGSSVYVRNTSSLYGGRDSYSVKYISEQDKYQALKKARGLLVLQMNGIHYPCIEAFKEVHLQNGFVNETSWRCQFVTYSLPLSMHVSAIRISGKNLLINVWFVARPAHVWVK